jgi:transcriptional regulator with XRE-family HTH domain
MARNLDSPRHDALRLFLVEKRKKAGLRQVDLAKLLKRRQDYVSYVETGHKLVEVIELVEWAEAIGFDPRDASRPFPKHGNNLLRITDFCGTEESVWVAHAFQSQTPGAALVYAPENPRLTPESGRSRRSCKWAVKFSSP